MLTLIFGLALAFTIGAQLPASDAKPDPRENLNTAIPEAIRLLEQKEYLKFLTTFGDPEDVAKSRDKLPAMAASMAGKEADRLLAILRHIQKLTPAMNTDGTTATYTPDPAAGVGTRPVRWERSGKLWYIAN